MADALKTNSTLQTLEYARLLPYSRTSAPCDTVDLLPLSLAIHSLDENNLTNFGDDMSGVIQLSESLKTNSTLQSLS